MKLGISVFRVDKLLVQPLDLLLRRLSMLRSPGVIYRAIHLFDGAEGSVSSISFSTLVYKSN